MPRSIWSGAISFGLVNVPVKLYSAVSKKTVRFNQLDARDGVRIQQKRVNPVTGEEVPYEQLVKGYEIGPDRYVRISPDELEALDPKATRTIDIQEFVDLAEIDPVFYDHPYYLAPATGGQKPYRLLVEAMREAGKVAIAKVVLRQKEHLVAIRPAGDALVLATMHFADEIVDPATIDEIAALEDVEASEREVTMAEQLIGSLEQAFDPGRFSDTYRQRVLELIEAKAAGEEIAVQPAEVETAPVPDLMAALEASLAAVKAGDSDEPEPEPPAKPRKAKAAATKPSGKAPNGGSPAKGRSPRRASSSKA